MSGEKVSGIDSTVNEALNETLNILQDLKEERQQPHPNLLIPRPPKTQQRRIIGGTVYLFMNLSSDCGSNYHSDLLPFVFSPLTRELHWSAAAAVGRVEVGGGGGGGGGARITFLKLQICNDVFVADPHKSLVCELL